MTRTSFVGEGGGTRLSSTAKGGGRTKKSKDGKRKVSTGIFEDISEMGSWERDRKDEGCCLGEGVDLGWLLGDFGVLG